jgi:hypothetical protein
VDDFFRRRGDRAGGECDDEEKKMPGFHANVAV